MARIFKLKNYSFTTKVVFSFFIMILLIYGIRTLLTVPKIHNENERELVEQITRTLMIIKNQFMIIGKSIGMQVNLELELTQEKIAYELEKNKELLNSFNEQELINFFSQNKLFQSCSYKIEKGEFVFEKINKIKKFDNSNLYKEWILVEEARASKAYRKAKNYFYNFLLENKTKISLACSRANLNPGHNSFEKDLKKYFHEKLVLGSTISDAKIALFWINPEFKDYEIAFYSDNEEQRKQRYVLSKLSNIENLPTGNLTLKQILQADEKKPIEHKIDNKEVLSWLINLNPEVENSRHFILVYTLNKEKIIDKNSKDLISLLNETLLTIAVSFLLIFLLFRRVLKNIDTITSTAIKVNQGEKNIRSKVKGEDDIGILGQAFDSMLDLFENNIKTLDKKVEEKTKEISKSLEEKELLLKEIHHRVKNNLALTIGLIELQQEEIQDEKTKKVLVDIQERIFTMELLHRKLYESENINDIPFKTYIKDLVTVISRSYDINNRVEVKIDMDEIALNIEKAMPCGLILNELITNSFKYAFCKNENPKLEISIQKKEEFLVMSIKDNGVGLKSDFEILNSKTLGLKLINTIVKFQLFGTINYFYESGAKFIIKAKIDEL